MPRRSLSPFAITCTVVALACATTGTAHAASCKKYKETSGCKVPNGTSYQVTKGANDEMNVTVYRGRGQFALRSACVQFRSKRFSFKSWPKVGKTYSFTETTTEVAELQDGITVTYTYKIAVKIKIDSALKATATGTASATAPAVPPQGSFGGEDAFNSNCKLNRTLKRVVER